MLLLGSFGTSPQAPPSGKPGLGRQLPPLCVLMDVRADGGSNWVFRVSHQCGAAEDSGSGL